MAQRIVTLCDICATEGQDVGGDVWRISIGRPETKPKTFDIDLCSEHATAVQSVQSVAADLGRPVAADGTTSTVRVAEADLGERLPCPICDKTSKNLASLRSHVGRTHGMTLAAAEGRSADHRCPECSDEFDTSQGLGVHRYRIHGTRGPLSRRAADRDPIPVEALSPTAAGTLAHAGTA